MVLEDDIRWFKQEFHEEIQATIRGTPFTIDLLTAIALQETGYIWRELYKEMPVAEVLKLCVGDTIDAPDRRAFPKNKSKLMEVVNGDKMFFIARESLESIAKYVSGYQGAVRNPDKFCRGFGIFQYDLQFFLENPSFFLEKRWYEFSESLNLCVHELRTALVTAYGRSKTELTDKEMVYTAIAYNTGSVNFDRGFKQGHFDGEKYYGQYIWEYLQTSKNVTVSTISTRVKWFELFRGEENGSIYPIVAGMDGDECMKLFHLKSRSIADLRSIFEDSSQANEFIVAPASKAIPTPIVED